MRLRSASFALVVAGLLAAGCSREDARLQQHREKFHSFAATARAIGDGWLSGALSGTYTQTAYAQTLQLVEQERTALAASPDRLADPRGAALSEDAEKLSRLLALLIVDTRGADATAARRHLTQIPLVPDQP